MKRKLVTLLTLALCPGVLFGATPASEYKMSAKQIAPNVYAVLTPARDFPNPENKGWNSNTAFVVTADAVLLFDSGSSQTIGEALKRTIATVTDKPVRWIVNSHGHGDHWLGNAAFSRPDLAIFASETVTKRVRNESEDWIERFNRMTNGATGKSSVVVPNTLINERTEKVLGGVRVIFIPSGDSHSPGDIVAWMPEQRVLLTGDVVYSDRMPSTFDAKVQTWIKFLGELEQLKPKVVVPGHGGLGDVATIRRQRELFQDLWAAVKAGFDAGKTDFEMRPDVSRALAKYRKYYPGFDEKLGRDISYVLLQVEATAF